MNFPVEKLMFFEWIACGIYMWRDGHCTKSGGWRDGGHPWTDSGERELPLSDTERV